MLWRLTGEVADARYALQDTLDKVGSIIKLLACLKTGLGNMCMPRLGHIQ